MAFDLDIVESLAPDQAALKAASKLIGARSWPSRAVNDSRTLIWGECQGSGANPYRVVADIGDHGAKCTCPSRKFPCKHSLALMWMFVTDGRAFATESAPEWVGDWLARRRKPGGGAAADKRPAAAKDLAGAQADDVAAPPDPKQEARREAASKKRAADTASSIRDGLDELEQWIADQLRLGLAGLLQDLTGRCRRIAARLVDAKAAALAGRIDEMPSRLMTLSGEEQLDATVSELGKLVLLARAYRADPEDPEIRRAVAAAESREQIIADPGTPRVRSVWEVLGEHIETRRDGLISQSTWLLDLQATAPRFALLLDFYPASAGRRGSAFTPGDRFEAELAFYPAKAPLRALIVDRLAEPAGAAAAWPAIEPDRDPLALYADMQDAAPWTLEAPILLPRGRVCTGPDGPLWWRADDGETALPVARDVPLPAQGIDLDIAAALWTGSRVRLLAARTSLGRLSFDG